MTSLVLFTLGQYLSRPRTTFSTVSICEEKPETWGVTDLLRESSILFQKLYNAIRQLWVVHAQTFDLVERDQDTSQKELVLFLERQSEAVYNGSQDLEKLSDTIEPLGFVYELEEHIVDGSADV